jgi:hypothetical protein
MHRILFTAALLAIAPACVHAQAAAPKVDAPVAPTAVARKSHNPFGAVIQELTRAAKEQAATAKATRSAPPAATPGSRDATPKAAPSSAVPATAPALADSNRS